MGKTRQYLLTLLLLIGLIGCKESNTKATLETITVSVKLPETSSSKSQEERQFKSVVNDVKTILLQVFNSDDLLSTKAMSKNDSTEIWSANLSLNPNDAPFNFRAYAYETEVTEVYDNTPIFTGKSTNVTTGNSLIVLSETLKSIEDSLNKLPALLSVKTLLNSDDTLNLTFLLRNETGGLIDYILSSQAVGGSTECASSLFNPATGEVKKTFTSTLTPDEENCESPSHFVTMTNKGGDSIKAPFSVDISNLTVAVAPAPLIKKINVIDNEESFGLNIVITNPDDYTYAWSTVPTNGTFDNAETQDTTLSGMNREKDVVVEVSVTDKISGAITTVRYQIVKGNE